MKSIFLMGCYNEYSGKWCTVTKVKGFTDDVLEKLQKEPEMIEIKKVTQSAFNYRHLRFKLDDLIFSKFYSVHKKEF